MSLIDHAKKLAPSCTYSAYVADKRAAMDLRAQILGVFKGLDALPIPSSAVAHPPLPTRNQISRGVRDIAGQGAGGWGVGFEALECRVEICLQSFDRLDVVCVHIKT